MIVGDGVTSFCVCNTSRASSPLFSWSPLHCSKFAFNWVQFWFCYHCHLLPPNLFIICTNDDDDHHAGWWWGWYYTGSQVPLPRMSSSKWVGEPDYYTGHLKLSLARTLALPLLLHLLLMHYFIQNLYDCYNCYHLHFKWIISRNILSNLETVELFFKFLYQLFRFGGSLARHLPTICNIFPGNKASDSFESCGHFCREYHILKGS